MGRGSDGRLACHAEHKGISAQQFVQIQQKTSAIRLRWCAVSATSAPYSAAVTDTNADCRDISNVT